MRNMFELPRSFGVLSSPELTTRIVRTDRPRSDSRIYRTKLYKSITLFEVGYYLNISSCSQIFRVHVKYLLIPSFETHILLLIIERIRYAPYGATQNVIPSKKQNLKNIVIQHFVVGGLIETFIVTLQVRQKVEKQNYSYFILYQTYYNIIHKLSLKDHC